MASPNWLDPSSIDWDDTANGAGGGAVSPLGPYVGAAVGGYYGAKGMKTPNFLNPSQMFDPSTHEQDKAALQALLDAGNTWDQLQVPELGFVPLGQYENKGDLTFDEMDLPEDVSARGVADPRDVIYRDANAQSAQRAADVSARRFDPETAALTRMARSSMEDVSTDPALRAKQLQAMSGLDEIVEGGGMTMRDRANLEKIRGQAAASDRGRRDAILQNMQARGMGGSGMELLAQLQSAQAASDQEAQAGLDTAATAEERALQAMIQSGQMAGSLRGQDFDQAARIAQAKDAVDQFNAANANQMAQWNAGAQNQAQQFNAANDLSAQQFNAGAANQMAQWNAGQQNQMAQFNAGNRFQSDMSNRDARLQNQQWNAGQQNQMAQFNQGNKIQVGMHNYDARNAAKQASWQNSQALHNANVDIANKEAVMNNFERPQAQYEMNTAKTAGKAGTYQSISDLYTKKADRKAAAASQGIGGLVTTAAGVAAMMSDERAKTDIEDLTDEDIAEFLEALQPKTYRYKKRFANGDDSKKAGFTMQDIEGTKVGDIITREGPDGTKAYDPQSLQGVILAALKKIAGGGDGEAA